MANELRVRSGFQDGVIDDNPLTNSATTLTSTELNVVPVIDTTNHMALILDPEETGGAPEIAYITAHTVGATTATILRGQEGTTARQHALSILWHHGPTIRDFSDGKVALAKVTAGNLTHALSSWGDLDNNLDLTIPGTSYVGDLVEVGLSARISNEAVEVYLDVASLDGVPAEVNYWGADGAESGTHAGVLAWSGPASAISTVGGSVMREIVSGDLQSGVLTLRFRVRCASASTKTINATTDIPLHVWAKNHGPGYTS